jgi:predicted phosphodiesterase
MPNPIQPALLVFGGPYSNLRALDALIARASELGLPADRCICTGDVVAYCAEPEETTAAIRRWGCQVVAGNCEEQLAAGGADCGCGFEAGTECDRLSKGWYEFANARISAESRAWMATLPKAITFTLSGRTFRVVHGGVDLINRFVFASMRIALEEELANANTDVVIAGHCGIPFVANVGDRVWFNPGVIGMPANDGTPDGWYGLVEVKPDHIVLSTHRLRYDNERAADAMRAHGHADGYMQALTSGLWPSLDVLPAEERAAAGARLAECVLRLPSPPKNRADD